MPGFTEDKLTEFIDARIDSVIEQRMPKDLQEVIRENVATVLKENPGEGVPQQLFGEAEEKTPKAEKGSGFACCLRALAAGRNDPEQAAKIAKSWGRLDVAEAFEKAMASNVPGAGGFLVPTEFSDEVIELLRASGVVRSLGPNIIPMSSGSIKVSKITSGSSASYIGENVNVPKSQVGTGQIHLTFKKLAALVPISNDLIRYSAPSADTIVRDDMIRALVGREDLAFIRGDGLDGTPKGIKNWIHADNKFASGGATLALVTTDLGDCMQLLMEAEIQLTMQQGSSPSIDARPGWMFSPQQWKFLTTVQTGLGTHAFRDEMLRGTLWGYPFRVTTQVEAGTVYFGAFAHAVIGESLGMTVDASQDAAYNDGSNVVAAFSLDQTVMRVLAEHDFALRHDKAFALITSVTWGA